jgi:hypothetical protein
MLSALFAIVIFFNRVLYLCPGPPGPQSSYLCFPWSWEWQACHTQLFIGWYGVSWTFCLGWPEIMILSVTTSWEARVTGISHHTWLYF